MKPLLTKTPVDNPVDNCKNTLKSPEKLADMYRNGLYVQKDMCFYFEGEPHEAEATQEDGAVVIRFDRKWYRIVDDFFEKAQIEEERLTSLYEELYGFEVTGS